MKIICHQQLTQFTQKSVILLGLFLNFFPHSGIAQSRKPNILLIMADDLGFSDLGCYGGEIPTPNLDKLARDGIKFSQFYNASRCCPTRASLLTGLYPHQAGMGHMTRTINFPPAYAGQLDSTRPTIAHVLKAGGYQTYHVGKWHVGNLSPKQSKANPLECGFNKFYGTGAGGNYFSPKELYSDLTLVTPPSDYYITDDLNEKSIQFIREHGKDYPDKPFFMHLCHTAPHFPLHARPEDIARHRGKYRIGWDTLREIRFRNQKRMGLFKPTTKLSPRDSVAVAWNNLTEPEKDQWDLRMATYAAMIEVMDKGLGRVFDALKELKIYDNTIIIFLSDNGSSAEVLDLWPGEDYSHTPGAECGTAKSHLCLEVGWSNAANTPFREHKMWMQQGGISTPFIIKIPGYNPDKQQNWNRNVGHIIDIMPTLIEMSGSKYPLKFRGSYTATLPGQSLVSAWSGRVSEERTLAWEHEGNKAIRQGNWKLVASFGQPWELYNLEKDPTEQNNLVVENPTLTEKLSRDWQIWANGIGVVPWENFPRSNYKPTKNYRRKSEPVPQ